MLIVKHVMGIMKMIDKKKLMFLFLILTVSPCVGVAQVRTSGVFVSVATGVDLLYHKTNAAVDVIYQPVSSLLASDANKASALRMSPLMHVSLGYHHDLANNWYYGVSIGYQILNQGSVLRHHSSDVESNNQNYILYTDQVKLHDQIDFSLLGGYRWRKLTSYVRVAYINSQLIYDNQYNFQNSHTPLTVPYTYANNSSTRRISGGLIGLGLMLPVSQHFATSVEYQFSLYENVGLAPLRVSKKIEGGGTGDLVYQADVHIKQMYASSVLVSLLYTF